uniref:Uncharacterized protein LOC111102714 n=1 Tax=Crassostrea virginica TaxID=6565 RepID=A0A8B8AJD9_CRAVI|nr:uncharacterized protein LOC111102714 [Crassostrea virginica]XP_022291285.1 uncharacterized protein LOC111102714 [Crassostrea virginica]
MYDFCYWMTTTPNNSTDSARLCAKDGGTVAWVNSAEAQAFVEKTYGGKMTGGSQFYIGVTDPVSEDYRTYTGEEQYYFNWDVVYTPMADWTCVFINYDNFKWRETKCFFPKLALCSKTIQREYLSSYFDRVHVGKTLAGHEVSVLENVTFIRCAFACQMNVRCKSINHDVSSRRCAINSGTAEAYPAQLTTAPNSNYYTVFI